MNKMALITQSFLVRHRLGDKAEAALSHVPGIKQLPCYDESGKLRPDSGCGQRKRFANGEWDQDQENGVEQ